MRNAVASEPGARELALRAAPVIVAIVAALLAGWVWGRVGEILLDFGNELYVAWQLSLGKCLYRDIDYRFGPLPPYANALWMWLFGPGVQTILIANAVVLVVVAIILYVLLIKMSDPLSAGVAMIAFLTLFAFPAGGGATDFNFLTPYRHGTTYGMLFSLGGLYFVAAYSRDGRLRHAALAGVLTGFCLLTKPEIFIACAAATGIGLIAASLALHYKLGRAVLAAFTGFAVVTFFALIALASKMPLKMALSGVLSGLQAVGNKDLVANAYYRWGMGTDAPGKNLRITLMSGGVYAALVAVLYGVAILVRKHRALAMTVGGMIGGGLGALLYFDREHEETLRNLAERGLPLAMVVAVAFTGIRLVRSRRDLDAARKAILPFAFAVLSLALLTKMILNARIFHYGFVLAMPAAMLTILGFLHALPRHIDARGGCGSCIRVGAVGLLVGIVAYQLDLTGGAIGQREAVAELTMGGSLLLPPAGSAAGELIKNVESRTPRTSTLAVFPYAAGINYAAARSSSIRFTACDPVQLAMVGEGSVVDALKASPPDFIVYIAHRPTNWGGQAPTSFGKDYGISIMKWIAENYTAIDAVPDPETAPPYVERITTLRRKSRAPPLLHNEIQR